LNPVGEHIFLKYFSIYVFSIDNTVTWHYKHA